MASSAEYDLICPVCHEIFKTPVFLPCTHSFCKECLQKYWRSNGTQECPICRRICSKVDHPINLALKNLCDSFLSERNQKHSSRSEEICSLHGEKLKLFCLEDKEPACLVCRDSQKHVNHTFRPFAEVIPLKKAELNGALKSLQEKLKHNEQMKGEFEKIIQHIKSQAEQTAHQMILQFEKLHQFLRDEEKATITALRKEEVQKKQMMEEKLEEINRHISALSYTIKGMEETINANDICFLKEFPISVESVHISKLDPQMPSEALIHVPRYLGNLSFRVWKKMQDIVHYTPIILNPNTANSHLDVSEDLTSVSFRGFDQLIPDNPERFDCYPCVLGSEGFNSGKHSWDVEVKPYLRWTLGVTTASKQRKGNVFLNPDVCSVEYGWSAVSGFCAEQKLERVRVNMDYERGKVSFSDPVNEKLLQTFSTTFTHTVYPFFRCDYPSSLRILPINNQ